MHALITLLAALVVLVMVFHFMHHKGKKTSKSKHYTSSSCGTMRLSNKDMENYENIYGQELSL